MRFQAYLPFLLAPLALATPIAQDAGENPNLVGEPATQGKDIIAERFQAIQQPDGYNPDQMQTYISFLLNDPNSRTRHACGLSLSDMLSAPDRYVDCEGPTNEGAPHFRYTIPDGNAVITGKDSSAFSLKVERIIDGQPTINAAQWVETNCVPFKNEKSTMCKAPANIKLVVDGEGAKPEKCGLFRKTFGRCS